MVPVKVMKLHPDAVIPKYARSGDAGFDLVAVEDVMIAPGQSAKIPTGIAFGLPEGYELQVRPRSGIGAKTKLRVSNAPGTVDSGFRGEVCVLMDNIFQPRQFEGSQELGSVYTLDHKESTDFPKRKYPEGTYIIKKGERIAQGVLAKVPIAHFEEAEQLDETERGTGGFGSSGVIAL